MSDAPTEQQRAALAKAVRAECLCGGECMAWRGDACEIWPHDVTRMSLAIATYLAATGREAEAEQVRRAGDGE